jgi:hypothetical protein
VQWSVVVACLHLAFQPSVHYTERLARVTIVLSNGYLLLTVIGSEKKDSYLVNMVVISDLDIPWSMRAKKTLSSSTQGIGIL